MTWSVAIVAAWLVTPVQSALTQDPPRWRADVRIVELHAARGPRGLEIRVRVTSDYDDQAKAATVEVLLPIGVAVVSIDPGCKPSQSPISSVAARVTCDLGDIAVKGLREINLVTTLPSGPEPAQIAAFAHSDTPDPNLTNNYVQKIVR